MARVVSKWAAQLAVMLTVIGSAGSVAAAPVEFDQASITQLEAAMASGKLSSEKLVQLCLARIKAYDRQGPSLHAVMALNPDALKEARALDAERKAKGPRSPLHGIPVIVKDNYNTARTRGAPAHGLARKPSTPHHPVTRECLASHGV